MLKKAIILSLIAVIIYACATVPITGRQQLSLVSNAEIIPMATAQYREVIKKGPLSTNQRSDSHG
jgi:hypothetical protein